MRFSGYSGWRSSRGSGRTVCRSRLGSVGSITLVACHRFIFSACGAGTCNLLSVRRSRSCEQIGGDRHCRVRTGLLDRGTQVDGTAVGHCQIRLQVSSFARLKASFGWYNYGVNNLGMILASSGLDPTTKRRVVPAL